MGVDGCESVIDTLKKNYEKKLAEVTKLLSDLLKQYRILCDDCRVTSLLSEWTFVTKYSVDMDSDWHPYPDEHCWIKCPACLKKRYVGWHKQGAEIIRLKKRGAKFKAYEQEQDRLW